MPELTTKEVSELLDVGRAELRRLCRQYRHGLEVRYGPKGTYLWSEHSVEIARGLLQPGNPRFKIEKTKEAEVYEATLRDLRRHILESKRLVETLESISSLETNPPSVTGFIHTLPHPDYRLVSPLGALIVPTGGGKFRATLVDADVSAEGATQPAALQELRNEVLMEYLRHARQPKKDPQRWRVFQRLVVTGQARKKAPAPRGKRS